MDQAHPLRAWRKSQTPPLTLDDVADRLSATGDRPSPAYLQHVENGINTPGWGLSKRIAALIEGDPMAIKDWQKPVAATTPDAA